MKGALVVIGTMDFREPGSAREYAVRFSAERPVLYVERQAGPEHLANPRLWPGRLTGRGLRRESANLLVFTPPPLFAAHNLSVTLNALQQRLLGARLLAVLEDSGWRTDALLVYQHNSAALIDSLRPRRSAYVAIDEFVLTARGWRRAVIAALERELAMRADAVLAAAVTVHERLRRIRPDVIRFPSAVDFALFDPARHADVPRRKNGVAVAATFDRRLDVVLLEQVARALPEFSFALFGRDDGRLAALRTCPNVTVHGQVPQADLPRALAPYPVCLLPYALTAETEGISSLKMVEYLALGKAVVASPVADARAQGSHLRLATTADDWVAQIRAAAAEVVDVAARRAALADHSYAARLATLRQVLGLR